MTRFVTEMGWESSDVSETWSGCRGTGWKGLDGAGRPEGAGEGQRLASGLP